MCVMSPMLALALALAPALTPDARAAATPGLSDSVARLDQLYAHRDSRPALLEAQRVADAAVAAAPGDYGVLWRAARAYFALSDDRSGPKSERASFGKTAWELGQRAAAANPSGVAGHYWSALGIGSSAQDMGIVRALANGIEGKFTGELRRATDLDPHYDNGNIFVAWGAYHMELPWPKRDRKKAEEMLHKALTINPASLTARLYLARLYLAEDRQNEARALLQEIAAAPIGRYDLPEERHTKVEAAQMAAQIK
jgi:tetratricopeptide (TPR) repeat protein